MSNERSEVTRRQALATGAVFSLGGLAGCTDLLDDYGSPEATDYSGPLAVNEIERADGGGADRVKVAVTVENTDDEAREADLVVTLSHTGAEGSLDRERALLLAPGLERTVVLTFRPQFYGESGADPPEYGDFHFDVTFENDRVYEDYPGLVTPSSRTALASGKSWPGVAYDAGTTAHNPGTEAPRSTPTDEWTESAVEYAFGDTGPVVANGTVYAGRTVRALSVTDGTEEWVHDGPDRTSPMAFGEGAIVFGTTDDLRAIEADSGDRRWNVTSVSGGTGVTVADGRAFSNHGQLHAVDAASGEVDWTADTGGRLDGPPPAAAGVVVSGGDPLRAFEAEDGTVRWAVGGSESVASAAVAYDTVFALTASQLTALDMKAGRTRWFAPGPFEPVRIAVGNGKVYAQRSTNYRVVAHDAETGDLEWTTERTDGMLGPPSVSDGVLVVRSELGTLYGFDTETGETLWSMSIPSGVPGSLAVADGRVYFNESNGPLRALGTGE